MFIDLEGSNYFLLQFNSSPIVLIRQLAIEAYQCPQMLLILNDLSYLQEPARPVPSYLIMFSMYYVALYLMHNNENRQKIQIMAYGLSGKYFDLGLDML